MKKFLRNLFSGFFLFIFALIIELLIIVFLQFFLDDIILLIVGEGKDELVELIVLLVYLVIRLIASITAVVIFFRIVNRQEDPEFKIPWIVGILLLPIFFTFFYILFANHGLKKKDRIIVNATRNAYNAHFLKSEAENKRVASHLDHAVGTFNYIHNTTLLGVHDNNRVKYYKNGEEFFPDLMQALREAKDFIFIEFFIITDGKLWTEVTEILKQKAAEGVEIKIIYDDLGCSGTISSRTPRMFKKLGIECHKFHPFRPILSGVYNNRDHRKIVVVDHKYGFTGGMNLADEYGNIIERFGYWKDTMVRIEGSAINNLIVTFLQNFNLTIYDVSDYNKYLTYDYEKFHEPGYVMPFGDGPGGIDDALIGEQTYVNILNYAKKRVDISTPYLIPTYGLIDAMRNAALRGVEVNLILPGIPDKKLVYTVAKSNFKYLMAAGVNIYLYTPGFNHMKTALADEELAFVGTINFDFRSLVHHFECGTLLYKNPCIKDIHEDFKEMISVSQKVPKNFKLSLGARCLCSLVKLITPLL